MNKLQFAMSDVKAIVLAAGRGSRLLPLTEKLPKPLVRVGNVPLIERILRELDDSGIAHIMVNLHHRADILESALRHQKNEIPSLEWRREPCLTGPAGGAACFRDRCEKAQAVLVVSGDAYAEIDYREFVRQHCESGAVLSFASARVSNLCDYGVAQVDADGRVIGFIEKPKVLPEGNLCVSAGIYCFAPALLERVPKDREYDFGRDLIPALVREGLYVRASDSLRFWRDVGCFRGLLEANIRAAENSNVESRAAGSGITLSGPIIIGRGTRIQPGVTIVGPTVLEDEVTIGTGTWISGSLVLAGASVPEGSVVLDGIVGSRTIETKQ